MLFHAGMNIKLYMYGKGIDLVNVHINQVKNLVVLRRMEVLPCWHFGPDEYLIVVSIVQL